MLPDVDPDNCARPTNPSDLVASEGDVLGATCTGTANDGSSTCDLDASTDGTADCPAGCDSEANLVYSYETCGNKNSYDHDRHYAYLRGMLQPARHDDPDEAFERSLAFLVEAAAVPVRFLM